MRFFWFILLLASEALAQPSSSPPPPAETSKTTSTERATAREATATTSPQGTTSPEGATSPATAPPGDGQSPPVTPPAAAPPDVPAATAVPTNEPAQPPTLVEKRPWYAMSPGKKLGLQLDVGAFDGAGLLALFRPWWWLRVNAGLAYNLLGVGIRGGLTVMPLHWGVTPTLSFDLGHYFSGDFSKFVTTSNPAEQALLNDAAYDFWSVQIGLEFGSQQGFLFYLRGGLVHLSDTLPGQDLTNYLKSTGQTAYSRAGDLAFSALLPALSLGFIYFIY